MLYILHSALPFLYKKKKRLIAIITVQKFSCIGAGIQVYKDKYRFLVIYFIYLTNNLV